MSWSYSSSLNVSEIGTANKPALIIKHSNRCSISTKAFARLNKSKSQLDEAFDVFLIDVVTDRPLSQSIAQQLNVRHESPQTIVIQNGKVVHSASHMSVNPSSLLEIVK